MFSALKAGYQAMGRGMGAAGRTAAIGAAAGGLWGAASDDTSVIGGMAMGAGLGLGGRYARAGVRSASRYARGPMSARGLGTAFAGGVARRAQRDAQGVMLRGNRAVNAFRGLGQ